MNKKTVFLLIAFPLLFACTKERPVRTEEDLRPESNIVQGVVVVKFSEEVTRGIEAGKKPELGIDISAMERVFPADDNFERRAREAGLHRWYRIYYSTGEAATKTALDIGAMDGVEIAETKQIIRNTAYFNDTYFSRMWHLYDGKEPTASINVVPVWQNYTTGSPDVIVGIIDGGVQPDHPDLDGVVIPGGPDGSRNFVDNGFVISGHSHGTHVGGTVAAFSNNGIGVAGIAGGNAQTGTAGVRLLSCQVIKTEDGKDRWGDTATAIYWAANHGASIINNSWGYDYDADGNGRLEGDELTNALAGKIRNYDKEAIDWFIDHAGYDADGNQVGPMAGGVVIFAAGNESIANGAPANYDRVVAVGATDENLRRASFSNYGDWVDIAAPGVEIYSTYPGDSYAKLQGTSMACPHVTGVAALLLSYYGGHGFTNSQLVDKLINGANKDVLPSGAQIGPFLDAMGSFTYSTPEAPDAVSDITSSASGNRISLDFTVTGNSSGIPAYSYITVASKDRSSVENYDPFSSAAEDIRTSTTLVGSKKVGEQITALIDNLEFEQEYYCAVIASSYQKRYSALSEIVLQATTENHAPTISMLEEGPFLIKATEEKIIPVKIEDPDGHSITFSFNGGSAAADYNYDSSSGILNVIIRGRRAEAGTYTAIITSSDSYGMSASFNVEYTILENAAPVISGALDDIIVYDKSKAVTVNLDGLFSDPEGDELTYKVRGNNVSLLKIDISGSQLKLTPKGYGLSKLTIVAVDPANKECSLPFSILVKNPDNVAESFPNPVSDKLTIRTEAEADTHIRLVNATGAVVYEKTLVVSGFNPAVLDMSACSPGRYTLTISYSGKNFSRTIIKK